MESDAFLPCWHAQEFTFAEASTLAKAFVPAEPLSLAFIMIYVTALQLKSDLLSPYFMDPNGLIPDENFIRSEAKNCEFEVTTLYCSSSEFVEAFAP